MEYLDQPFQVFVGSGRRPTPTAYEHLRKYSALELAYLKLSSQFDITNVNSILEQTANLYVSNEIHRVIAQVIGQSEHGFVTIKGTEDGALHVYLAGVDTGISLPIAIADGDDAALGAIADAIVAAGAVGTISAKLRRATQGLEDLKTSISLAYGTNLIGSIVIAGIAQPLQSAKINITGAGTVTITSAAPAGRYHIVSIMFTVDAEVNVTLRDETEPTLSGPMDFGASGEPMGLAHNFGNAPLPCTAAKKFQITTVGTGKVNGLITFYDG